MTYRKQGTGTERLREVVAILGGGEAAGQIAGVSENMISRYLQGHSKPSFATIKTLAQAADVSLDWIAGLDLKEHAMPAPPPPQEAPHASPSLDTDLLAHISDAISATYRDASARIHARDLVILSGKMYAEIAALSDDPVERRGMVKLRAAQLKQDLATPLSHDRSKHRA